jgi:hypothetical protein
MDQKIIEIKYDNRTEYHLGTEDGPLHRLDGPAIIWKDGHQEWYVEGKLHRLDGPAIIWKDGHQEWFVEGFRHRLDGPACIWADGTQEWFVEGFWHRQDGPAYIGSNGSQAWYVEDHLLNEEQVSIAQHILSDMPLEDTMLYISDPVLSKFVKTRLKITNSIPLTIT